MATIPKYNAIIQILLNFQHILCFSDKAYLATIISVIEPIAGVNKAKVYLKIAENCKFSYLQSNNSNMIESLNLFLHLLEKQIRVLLV